MTGAVGMLELSSIAAGFVVQDAVLKAADVELLVARTICPGKYMIVIGGKVGSVKAAMEAGLSASKGFLVEQLVLPNIDQAIFPAISGCVELVKTKGNALGVIETFSAASILRAADAAVKAAGVTLFRVHLSMAVGGKGFLLLAGDVGSVTASINSGVETIKDDGMLVNKAVISGASKELFKEYL
ncbi:BMC domain-containing protein [Desulfogranum marinum]|jgi:microcompartment protein CcmL/EutN|uniref:BMC domain-containing protein n=1 Tax=Desulfogranum marinum TaxID=453220 RepID=UPI001963409A|nr:BMC domain-containing protein [Desulfogranum marinum]MBM9512612.1 BMC domain-containing protein [Desulfogranum marinum]